MNEERPITKPGDEPDCDFWTTDSSAEELSHTDIHGALDDWRQKFGPEDKMPETVYVYGWRRQKISNQVKEAWAMELVERLLELIAEDYMPAGQAFNEEDEERFIYQARRLVGAVVRVYPVFNSDYSGEMVLVRVKDWCEDADIVENK